jgi:hypothetical protein
MCQRNQTCRNRNGTEESRNSQYPVLGRRLTSINQSRRTARILACRRGCRCRKCSSRRYAFSLFSMIFQTSSLFAQLQEENRKHNPNRLSGCTHAPGDSGLEAMQQSQHLLQHRQRGGSGRPAFPRLKCSIGIHQLLTLFFVGGGDHRAGICTYCVIIPRLTEKHRSKCWM